MQALRNYVTAADGSRYANQASSSEMRNSRGIGSPMRRQARFNINHESRVRTHLRAKSFTIKPSFDCFRLLLGDQGADAWLHDLVRTYLYGPRSRAFQVLTGFSDRL